VPLRDVREQVRVRRLPPDELVRSIPSPLPSRLPAPSWLSEKKPHDFAAHIRAAVDALKAVAAEGGGKTKAAMLPKKRATRRT